MFTKVASLIAIGLGLALLALIGMVYLSIEALGTTMEEVTDSIATSIETGSGTVATGMGLMSVGGVAGPPGAGNEATLDPPAVQRGTPAGTQMPQGNQPDPVQEGKTQVELTDGRQGQTPIAHRPMPNIPGSGERTSQILRYAINKKDNQSGTYRLEDSHLKALIQAGALTITMTENGKDYQSLLPDQEDYANYNDYHEFVTGFFVFFAPVTKEEGIKKWFTDIQTVSNGNHTLLYQVWNNRDEPLPENIPENYRLEYLAVEGPDPTTSYSEHHQQSSTSYGLNTFPYHPSGRIRFGELNPELCASAIENSNKVETEVDCLDDPDLYQFHFPIASHDHIVTWHQSADFVADRDSRFFWRLLAKYSETNWQTDSEDEHQLLQYYDGRGKILHPAYFNVKAQHEGCLCLKASQHAEVAEWFAAQRALQTGPTQLYWAPVWKVQ